MCLVLHDRVDVSVMEEPRNPSGAAMRDRSESAIRTGLFAGLAVVAAVAYQLLLIGLILLRPEIDPARKPISEYAIGRLGWLAVLAFQISGAAFACLVVALRHMLRDRLGRIGMVVAPGVGCC
jgi:Protein of unknown function (DUF998)